MHTIIREVLTVGEKTTSIQCETHMHLSSITSLMKQKSAEYTNMNYDMQQPGGLTDAQFDETQDNLYAVVIGLVTPWNVFSLNFDTKINSRLSSNTKLFGLVGERNSVGFTTQIL
jgi:Fe(3+) dicitrate transport protein